ncbi:MAG: glycosyltransferase [Anaerococcus vaginalis]|nr:glycosyltransferase [Anaerococcus vaginalis]
MIKGQTIDFSIVTIVNKQDVFKEFCKGVEQQIGVSFELIPIFNFDGDFKSARRAFNSVLDKCNGKYIIFTHPDIRFGTHRELHKTKIYLDQINEFGVVGAAGATSNKNNKNKRIIYSNIVHGSNKRKAGVTINSIQEVQTVDECFFILNRSYISSNKFSTLEGWHLYSVEMCLKCILENKKNYVIPLNIWHLSDGKSLDSNYMHQLNKIIKIYKNDFPILYTTVKLWKTKGILSILYRHYYYVKQRIKKILRWKNAF